MVGWPMTAQIKGYPFEDTTEIDGKDCAILYDQVKSLDWKTRKAKKKAIVSIDTMIHVKVKGKALLQIA